MGRSNNKIDVVIHGPALIGPVDIAVLSVALIWGASYPIAKGALIFAPVFALIFYRFLVTSVVMTLIARREIGKLSAEDCLRGMILGVILFAIFAAETFGVSQTSATNTTLIISLCVVFTPILDYALSRRLPPAGILVGTFVSCFGVLFLTGGITALTTGDVLVLGAAILRSIMVVATKRLLAGRKISSAALTAIQSITVAVLTVGWLSGRGELESIAVDAGYTFWTAIAFLSLFCTVAAFYIQNAAVRHSSPTRVSLLMGFEPLFGCLLAHLLLSEPFFAATVVGAGLVVVGTFTGIVFEHRSQNEYQRIIQEA